MAVQPQSADATADGAGEAVFMFPDVPSGQLWIGTVTIPKAPASAAGTVNLGGQPVGPIFGPGVYGPYVAGPTRRLSLSIVGLAPDTQYEAVWHADDEGQRYSTWPGTVTTTVEGTVVIPTPVDVAIVSPLPVPVDGTVDVGNFPAIQPVSGTVTTEPTLAGAVSSGQTAMTGAAVALPNHPAVQGVVLSAPASNTGPISVGAAGVTAGSGMILSPGQAPTPVLPVDNSDVLHAIGTSGDVLSFLVT
ncbi:MAG TPA: hypothetical protein VNV87_12260 [Acidimicrobiales bacterium]|jgi:hypothetical protein|nr:hypothetical protein [Acidimicrobiales bacterium]